MLKTGFYSVGRPLWLMTISLKTPFVKVKDFFVFKNSLINDNLALTDQITALKLKEIDYDTLLKENEKLKEELGKKTSAGRIVSKVLSRPPQSPYDTIVLDSGSSEGVTLGNRVYLSDTVIVGTITNITPHTSLVELFSTGNHKQQVTSDRTGASFEAVGLGGANLKIEVPKDTDILWGDTFNYNGTSGAIVGSVYYIDTNSQSSFKTVYLRVPGNLFQTEWVYIEKM